MSNSAARCPECGAVMDAVGQLEFSLDLHNPEGATLWICESPACRRRRDDALGDIVPPPWVDDQR